MTHWYEVRFITPGKNVLAKKMYKTISYSKRHASRIPDPPKNLKSVNGKPNRQPLSYLVLPNPVHYKLDRQHWDTYNQLRLVTKDELRISEFQVLTLDIDFPVHLYNKGDKKFPSLFKYLNSIFNGACEIYRTASNNSRIYIHIKADTLFDIDWNIHKTDPLFKMIYINILRLALHEINYLIDHNYGIHIDNSFLANINHPVYMEELPIPAKDNEKSKLIRMNTYVIPFSEFVCSLPLTFQRVNEVMPKISELYKQKSDAGATLITKDIIHTLTNNIGIGWGMCYLPPVTSKVMNCMYLLKTKEELLFDLDSRRIERNRIIRDRRLIREYGGRLPKLSEIPLPQSERRNSKFHDKRIIEKVDIQIKKAKVEQVYDEVLDFFEKNPKYWKTLVHGSYFEKLEILSKMNKKQKGKPLRYNTFNSDLFKYWVGRYGENTAEALYFGLGLPKFFSYVSNTIKYEKTFIQRKIRAQNRWNNIIRGLVRTMMYVLGQIDPYILAIVLARYSDKKKKFNLEQDVRLALFDALSVAKEDRIAYLLNNKHFQRILKPSREAFALQLIKLVSIYDRTKRKVFTFEDIRDITGMSKSSLSNFIKYLTALEGFGILAFDVKRKGKEKAIEFKELPTPHACLWFEWTGNKFRTFGPVVYNGYKALRGSEEGPPKAIDEYGWKKKQHWREDFVTIKDIEDRLINTINGLLWEYCEVKLGIPKLRQLQFLLTKAFRVLRKRDSFGGAGIVYIFQHITDLLDWFVKTMGLFSVTKDIRDIMKVTPHKFYQAIMKAKTKDPPRLDPSIKPEPNTV